MDHQTGVQTNLSERNYAFITLPGVSECRFEISYQLETVLTAAGSSGERLIVYKDGGDFVVKAQATKISGLEVYDTSVPLVCNLNPTVRPFG